MDSKLTAGDARLMKARCQAQIERLQAAANVTPDNELRRAIEIDVMIYQAALASLQSKPIGIVNVDARGCAAKFYQLMSGGELIYTAPPALQIEPVADVLTWSHPSEERKCSVQLRRFDLEPGPLYAAKATVSDGGEQ